MDEYDSSLLVSHLQKALIRYEQSLLRIAHGVELHSQTHKSSKTECEEIVAEIKPMISRARRNVSVGVEAFSEISLELVSREREIQHMEARIKLNKEMLTRAEAENNSIQNLTRLLDEL